MARPGYLEILTVYKPLHSLESHEARHPGYFPDHQGKQARESQIILQLTYLSPQIAIAYRDPLTGETLESFPADVDVLDRVEVVYRELEGWNKPTT